MKAQILVGLDKKIAEIEKECAEVDAKLHSYRAGIWYGLLQAREIVQVTPEEGVKHG